MKKKKIARNLLSIFLMSFYASCGRHDILDERTERNAIEPVQIILAVDSGGDFMKRYEVC
ncbi:MAG: hypothetical protein JRF52_09380 [Deltaproteobacteria bacterium]|jgi:hypothetical protein|uniref:Uncharacterized protein n=1 Tax=Candidatus Desulfacyla euxinica TaxID=2841693 RepID=A0A8J6MXN2_9DELT|nr:hypothetical protein [Candidatus Desulfacyla euxinica]MBL7216068.1 hypothetical protein [Desulfobacteraceae bacterium]MBW1852358.1 hypothetical protein [Deltaproteobacteria bacterium]MBW2204287.1 hypothetical protein [Deltaproteobacteria bacterium]